MPDALPEHDLLKEIPSPSRRSSVGPRIVLSIFILLTAYTIHEVHWMTVKSGRSYLSQSDRSVTFGLGQYQSIEEAQPEWPNGLKRELGRLV